MTINEGEIRIRLADRLSTTYPAVVSIRQNLSPSLTDHRRKSSAGATPSSTITPPMATLTQNDDSAQQSTTDEVVSKQDTNILRRTSRRCSSTEKYQYDNLSIEDINE